MQLGRAAAFGVAALAYLQTREPARPASTEEIAQASAVPIEYLRKLLQRLCRAGLIICYRGRSGGFALARPAGEITLLQIVEAIEGQISEATILCTTPAFRPDSRIEQSLSQCRQLLTEHLRRLLSETPLTRLLEG